MGQSVPYRIRSQAQVLASQLFSSPASVSYTHLDALVGKGYSFVGRYIDYLKGAHNDLTEKEVGLICNAGLEIVSLYQPKAVSYTHLRFLCA